MKPILRWTIGNIHGKKGYEILNFSVKKMFELYGNEFQYFIFYNDIDISKLKPIFKYKNLEIIQQKWEDCPLPINEPYFSSNLSKQKTNGSLWKICPPRLEINTHEIILDNDLIFTKRPEIIEEFLSRDDKNLVIRDSNIYLGEFEKFFNDKQGFNSGVMGLKPKYDFGKKILETWENEGEGLKVFNYGDEQGFLMLTLLKENCLIGRSEDFVGIQPKVIFLTCVKDELLKPHLLIEKKINKKSYIEPTHKQLRKIFSESSVIHFLQSNRVEKHIGWDYFKFLNKIKTAEPKLL